MGNHWSDLPCCLDQSLLTVYSPMYLLSLSRCSLHHRLLRLTNECKRRNWKTKIKDRNSIFRTKDFEVYSFCPGSSLWFIDFRGSPCFGVAVRSTALHPASIFQRPPAAGWAFFGRTALQVDRFALLKRYLH